MNEKRCHWYLKGKNFESNSQQVEGDLEFDVSCHWYLKGKGSCFFPAR